MADIELVIKMPEEVKNRLCFGVTYAEDIKVICEALNDGTPLDSVIEEERKKYNDILLDLLGEVEDYEKAIEDIKAEIEQNAYPIVHGVNNHEKGMTLYGILQVLDNIGKEKSQKFVDDVGLLNQSLEDAIDCS